MVWFQCEDCGENLKKPKLANHFRICSANKLSCIDCGEMFGQDSVQGHTQCITEAEKYGPKGQGKISNGATPKSNNNKQQQPDFDITVGLSDRPPWFCSLCHTKATSKQTLLLHADGKKHRAKARAIHASKQQQSNQTQLAASQNITNAELQDSKQAEEEKVQDTPHAKSETENGSLQSKKKRKLDDSESNRTWVDAADKKENVATQEIKSKAEGIEGQLKKAKQNGLHDSGSIDDTNKKIKLKKLVKSTLKTDPSGVMKMKKLKKLVLKTLRESGVTIDETQVNGTLEQKINTSSRFRIDGKYVHLAGKD